MSLAERFLKSQFVDEPTLPTAEGLNGLSNTAKVLWLLEMGALATISFSALIPLDADVNNQIMNIPDFMHGRMHDFMGGVVVSSLGRMMPSRGKSMAFGFGLNATWEAGSLVEPYFGTFDAGDLVAYGLGAITWGTIDYLKTRGMERLKRLVKPLEPPAKYSAYMHRRNSLHLTF